MDLIFAFRALESVKPLTIPPSYTISVAHCELLIKNAPHHVSFEANIHIEILRKNIRFVIADSWNS